VEEDDHDDEEDVFDAHLAGLEKKAFKKPKVDILRQQQHHQHQERRSNTPSLYTSSSYDEESSS
jgi:hypothetical protein